ncbi:hypothetical protein AB0K67_02195 [Nonomuraea sp. NPDC052634]|uniref:hypothetical protein n=1 Tax=Nonomuraea sp. NPDC052634 TaxID=3155813 RepID=UPI003423BEED
MTDHRLPQERDLPAHRHALRKTHLMTLIDQQTATPPARRPRWPVLAALATAAAAALVIGLPIALDHGGTPANAVIREPDGSIKIYITDYKHPELIERRLRGFGVQADVTFLPAGKDCKEPRATYLPDNPALLTAEPPAEGEETYSKLHPEQIKPGQTFVYTLWYIEDGDDRMAIARPRVATGPVAPCEVIPGGPELRHDPHGGIGG